MTLPIKQSSASAPEDVENPTAPLLTFPDPFVPDGTDEGIDNPFFINEITDEYIDKAKKNALQRKDLAENSQFHPTQEHIIPPLIPSEAWNNLTTRSSIASQNDDLLFTEKRNSVNERIHELAVAFSQRTQSIKKNINNVSSDEETESEEEEEDDIKDDDEDDLYNKLDTVFANSPDIISRPNTPFRNTSLIKFLKKRLCKCLNKIKRPIDPQGTLALVWQFCITVCLLYNGWGIFLRISFPYQTSDNVLKWLIADYVADGFYVLDIVWFRMRSRVLFRGFWMKDLKSIQKAYTHSRIFLLDLVSLLPLDLLYLKFGVISLFRLPRLLKVHIYWEFFANWDRFAHSPYFVRSVRTIMYMLYMIHLNACAYYAFSNYRGIGRNTWTYDGQGNAYVRCFLFALKTAVSIGKNPKPTEESEFIFMTVSWLLGVFIFAILIGQIKDIMSTAAQNKTIYQRTLDRIQAYMQRLHLPEDLQERVYSWYEHMWEDYHGLDEQVVMGYLPKKMRSDLALYIHFHSLNKVELFKGLERDLLRDLVLKLISVLYLPGDYICKKGEVGKEMYIVNNGYIQVMGGENNDKVLVTLGEGSVFGELSLLAIGDCGNRRTADVRAKGFAELFILNKACLEETVREYPEAQAILKKKAKKLIKKKMKPEEKDEKAEKKDDYVIIKNRPETPRLIQTVLEVLPESSRASDQLRKASNVTFQSLISFDNEDDGRK